MNIKEKAKQIKNKITVVFLAYKRKDVPILAKILAAITIAYALSPIDLIPDFVPILGYLDDIIILPLLISLCIKLIPPNVIAECETQAINLWKNGKPKRWYYAIPIVLIWICIISLVVYTIYF